MVDEELRHLQRAARESGDPNDVLNYVDAALRSVGAPIPVPDPSSTEVTRLVLRPGHDTLHSRPGEAVIRYDRSNAQVVVSINGGSFVPFRTGYDDPRHAHRGVPRSLANSWGPGTAYNEREVIDHLLRTVDALFQILSDLGYAYREG